jgi:hypothetical protein
MIHGMKRNPLVTVAAVFLIILGLITLSLAIPQHSSTHWLSGGSALALGLLILVSRWWRRRA